MRRVFQNSRGRLRCGFRLLFYLAVFLTLLVLAKLAVPWASINNPDYAEGSPIHDVLRAVSSLKWLAAALVATFLTTRLLDRRPFASVGLWPYRGAWRHLLVGAALGAIAMSAIALLLLALGQATVAWRGAQADVLAWAVPLTVLVTLAIATNEEFVFRGYLFQLLIEAFGPLGATLAVAALFGVVHAFNEHGTVPGAIGTALWGAALCWGTIRTRSLWLAVGTHWTANLFEGVVWGMPSSGQTYCIHLVHLDRTGYELLTGGAFGPEAGLLTLPVGVALVAFLLLWRNPRPDEQMTAFWERHVLARGPEKSCGDRGAAKPS